MPTQNVNLTVPQARFVKRGVKTGRYQNASEMVRAGLRLLEQQEREEQMKLRHLRKLIDEGIADIDNGNYEVLDPANLNAFLESVSAKSRARRKP